MDDRYQNPARSGNDVTTAMRAVATHPPFNNHERRIGTLMSRRKRAALENPSAPGPSAGRTPSLIEGDFTPANVLDQSLQLRFGAGDWTCRNYLHATVFVGLNGLWHRLWSGNEINFILRCFQPVNFGWHSHVRMLNSRRGQDIYEYQRSGLKPYIDFKPPFKLRRLLALFVLLLSYFVLPYKWQPCVR